MPVTLGVVTDDAQARLAGRFARHGESLEMAPMYRDLMLRCAADIAAGGPVWQLMAPHAGTSGSVAALRLLGAVHRLVLSGRAPGLAPYYPSVGGVYDGDLAWPAFLDVLPDTEPWLDRTVQTNEPARAAALLGGFHAVSLEFGRPLRLLEAGASAGLLLRFDAYRYDLPSSSWGDLSSPVRLAAPDVPLDPSFRVASRAGCDANPIDPASEEGRLTLLSYVWPHQLDRIERLRAALDVAVRVPVPVEKADAVSWVRAALAEPPGDAVPVVYHSIVMQYLTPAAREEFASVVREADVSPRAWLRFEPEDDRFVVRLTTWPGGHDRLLAVANPHGYDVSWLTT
jgi:hypothetical protein